MPAIPFPEIDPVAVQIGPLAIHWYALAYLAGILLGWRYVKRLSSRRESPVARSTVEFLREPDAQLGFAPGPYSMGQVLSAPLVVLGVYLVVHAWAAPKPQHALRRGPGV